MKFSLVPVSLSMAATAVSQIINGIDVHADWRLPHPSDSRTPCPGLNALANHGLLPRNGRNITRSTWNPAVQAIGFDERMADILFDIGLDFVGTPNGTSWDFEPLNEHNLLEHDGSLSRDDFHLGDHVAFSWPTFAQTLAYFPDPVVTLQQGANAHLARMYLANGTNPDFNLTETGEVNSFGETILYASVLGDVDTLDVRRDFVEYFFQQERFPFALGWQPKNQTITGSVINQGMQRMRNLTSGSFPSPSTAVEVETRAAVRARSAKFGRELDF